MRLKEDDQSWRAQGIIRRDFRSDPGLPETEAITKGKKKKTKHRHTIKGTKIGEREASVRYIRRDGTRYSKREMRPYYLFSCECGWRRAGFSASQTPLGSTYISCWYNL